MHSLVQECRLLGTGTCEVGVVARGKVGAGSDDPAIVGVKTVRHGVSLHVHVPTVHKIAMEAISCRVAVGKDKFSAARLIDEVGEV
jgi:hypothetical protein